MTTPTITEFLLERIAEDEVFAHQAREMFGGVLSDVRWRADGSDDDCTVTTADDSLHIYDEGGHSYEQARHIARHDPMRVLAECAAKRAILEFHQAWPVLIQGPTNFETPVSTDLGSIVTRATSEIAWWTTAEYVKRFGSEAPSTPMIAAMAAVYADHPDYQEEWADVVVEDSAGTS